jgi:DNA-binding MarR family transcriptional regulator
MEKYDDRIRQIALMTIQGMTQTKIAEKMGITKQRVGQLVGKAERAGIPVLRRQIKKSRCAACSLEYIGKNKFCSKKCRNMVPRNFGGPSSEIQLEIMLCDGCGTKFSRTRRLIYIGRKVAEKNGKVLKRTFCTRDCYFKNGAGR